MVNIFLGTASSIHCAVAHQEHWNGSVHSIGQRFHIWQIDIDIFQLANGSSFGRGLPWLHLLGVLIYCYWL